MGSPILRGTIRARVWVRERLGLKTARATCSASANRCHDERELLPVTCRWSRSLPPPNSRGFPRSALTEQILDGCVTRSANRGCSMGPYLGVLGPHAESPDSGGGHLTPYPHDDRWGQTMAPRVGCISMIGVLP